MYTFSSMQRSITYQNNIVFTFNILFLGIYESLAGIFPSLPPLLAVIYFLLLTAFEKKNFYQVSLLLLLLVLFEINFSYFIFSSVIFFIFIKLLFIPKLYQVIECKKCQLFIFTFFTYFGFWLFYNLIAKVFLLDFSVIDYHIIFYIMIEFIILSIL